MGEYIKSDIVDIDNEGGLDLNLVPNHFIHLLFTRRREEEEEEEEVVQESAKKKKYSRDGENPTPWKVLTLATPSKDMQMRGQNYDETWEQSFFPTSEFAVKNSLFSKAVRVNFPNYLYMSNNCECDIRILPVTF